MNNKKNQNIREILSALNDLIIAKSWDETNFLKIMGRELKRIRDSLNSEINDFQESDLAKADQLAKKIAQHTGQKKVFIALYSSEGDKIQSWERILNNLRNQMISRPIYANEEDVEAWIKSKENKLNEAYVAIYIDQSDLLSIPEDKVPVDKLGKKLLVLKDNTISLNNICNFIHQSGVYLYEHGRLIKEV